MARGDRASNRPARAGRGPKNKPPRGSSGGSRGPAGPPRVGGTGYGTTHSGGCCPMAAAVRSAKDGRWRAARLYSRLAVRSLAARLA